MKLTDKVEAKLVRRIREDIVDLVFNANLDEKSIMGIIRPDIADFDKELIDVTYNYIKYLIYLKNKGQNEVGAFEKFLKKLERIEMTTEMVTTSKSDEKSLSKEDIEKRNKDREQIAKIYESLHEEHVKNYDEFYGIKVEDETESESETQPVIEDETLINQLEVEDLNTELELEKGYQEYVDAKIEATQPVGEQSQSSATDDDFEEVFEPVGEVIDGDQDQEQDQEVKGLKAKIKILNDEIAYLKSRVEDLKEDLATQTLHDDQIDQEEDEVNLLGPMTDPEEIETQLDLLQESLYNDKKNAGNNSETNSSDVVDHHQEVELTSDQESLASDETNDDKTSLDEENLEASDSVLFADDQLEDEQQVISVPELEPTTDHSEQSLNNEGDFANHSDDDLALNDQDDEHTNGQLNNDDEIFLVPVDQTINEQTNDFDETDFVVNDDDNAAGAINEQVKAIGDHIDDEVDANAADNSDLLNNEDNQTDNQLIEAQTTSTPSDEGDNQFSDQETTVSSSDEEDGNSAGEVAQQVQDIGDDLYDAIDDNAADYDTDPVRVEMQKISDEEIEDLEDALDQHYSADNLPDRNELNDVEADDQQVELDNQELATDLIANENQDANSDDQEQAANDEIDELVSDPDFDQNQQAGPSAVEVSLDDSQNQPSDDHELNTSDDANLDNDETSSLTEQDEPSKKISDEELQQWQDSTNSFCAPNPEDGSVESDSTNDEAGQNTNDQETVTTDFDQPLTSVEHSDADQRLNFDETTIVADQNDQDQTSSTDQNNDGVEVDSQQPDQQNLDNNGDSSADQSGDELNSDTTETNQTSDSNQLSVEPVTDNQQPTTDDSTTDSAVSEPEVQNDNSFEQSDSLATLDNNSDQSLAIDNNQDNNENVSTVESNDLTEQDNQQDLEKNEVQSSVGETNPTSDDANELGVEPNTTDQELITDNDSSSTPETDEVLVDDQQPTPSIIEPVSNQGSVDSEPVISTSNQDTNVLEQGDEEISEPTFGIAEEVDESNVLNDGTSDSLTTSNDDSLSSTDESVDLSQTDGEEEFMKSTGVGSTDNDDGYDETEFDSAKLNTNEDYDFVEDLTHGVEDAYEESDEEENDGQQEPPSSSNSDNSTSEEPVLQETTPTDQQPTADVDNTPTQDIALSEPEVDEQKVEPSIDQNQDSNDGDDTVLDNLTKDLQTQSKPASIENHDDEIIDPTIDLGTITEDSEPDQTTSEVSDDNPTSDQDVIPSETQEEPFSQESAVTDEQPTVDVDNTPTQDIALSEPEVDEQKVEPSVDQNSFANPDVEPSVDDSTKDSSQEEGNKTSPENDDSKVVDPTTEPTSSSEQPTSVEPVTNNQESATNTDSGQTLKNDEVVVDNQQTTPDESEPTSTQESVAAEPAISAANQEVVGEADQIPTASFQDITAALKGTDFEIFSEAEIMDAVDKIDDLVKDEIQADKADKSATTTAQTTTYQVHDDDGSDVAFWDDDQTFETKFANLDVVDIELGEEVKYQEKTYYIVGAEKYESDVVLQLEEKDGDEVIKALAKEVQEIS